MVNKALSVLAVGRGGPELGGIQGRAECYKGRVLGQTPAAALLRRASARSMN
jgi:hypothetical protein